MAEENVPRSKGVVQRFNNQKGYGFIKPEEGDDDLFVHQTDIKLDGYRTLRAGQEVEFDMVLDKDKYKAANVTAPGGGPVDTAPRRRISGRGTSERRNGDNGYIERRSNGNGGGGGRGCYSCGEFGHRAQDCENEVICYNCRGVGHLARECPSEARGGGRVEKTCYTCKQPGHLVRDCTSGGGEGEYHRGGEERVCYNCQQPGHLKRNCPSQGDGGSGYSGGGDSGKVGGGKSGDCYNCGKFGHFSRDCKKPPRPRA